MTAPFTSVPPFVDREEDEDRPVVMAVARRGQGQPIYEVDDMGNVRAQEDDHSDAVWFCARLERNGDFENAVSRLFGHIGLLIDELDEEESTVTDDWHLTLGIRRNGDWRYREFSVEKRVERPKPALPIEFRHSEG